MLKQKGNKIVLCGRKKCCPELTILENGHVQIIDDNGNVVKIEKQQALLINQAIKQLEKS